MSDRFSNFMKPLKETHFSLKDYVDFPKVAANVEAISIKLNQLNYLIGQEDMAAAVKRLWNENPKVFSVLDVLIAVRAKDKKKAIDAYGNIHLVSDYFTSPEQVTVFLNETGLTEVFQKKQIKNLVDKSAVTAPSTRSGSFPRKPDASAHHGRTCSQYPYLKRHPIRAGSLLHRVPGDSQGIRSRQQTFRLRYPYSTEDISY